jgi:hypothetical protein
VLTAFKLFLKADEQDCPKAESDPYAKLNVLSTSQYAEVQDIASLTASITHMIMEDDMADAFEELASPLTPNPADFAGQALVSGEASG